MLKITANTFRNIIYSQEDSQISKNKLIKKAVKQIMNSKEYQKAQDKIINEALSDAVIKTRNTAEDWQRRDKQLDQLNNAPLEETWRNTSSGNYSDGWSFIDPRLTKPIVQALQKNKQTSKLYTECVKANLAAGDAPSYAADSELLTALDKENKSYWAGQLTKAGFNPVFTKQDVSVEWQN